MKIRFIIIFLFVVLFGLSACGGGDASAPQDSSDWDTMVWDQDNWS